MKKEDIYFESRDGVSKLHAIVWSEENKSPVGILQMIHGMAEYIDRYDEFARFMVEKGYVVVGHDHLGHGDSVGEKGIYGYFCKKDPATVLVRDAHRLKRFWKENTRVFRIIFWDIVWGPLWQEIIYADTEAEFRG